MHVIKNWHMRVGCDKRTKGFRLSFHDHASREDWFSDGYRELGLDC